MVPQSPYVHASKQTKLEDFTIQASQGFKHLQLTSKVSLNIYNKRLSPISYPKCIPTLTTSQFNFTKRITKLSLTQCVWIQMKAQYVWINEMNTKFMLLDLQRIAQNINGCMMINEFNLSQFIVEEEN